MQRLALRTKEWFSVVTAGLTGNAVTNSLPGGSAAGAAVQFRILTTAGFDTDTAVGGLTAFSLLEVGGLLALPIFALPAILAGVPVSRGLVHTALLGIAAFVLYAVFGVIVLHTDWPLATLGRAAQSLWNRITRGHRPPVTGLDQRLLAERDTIRAVLGKNWRQAALLTAAGRLRLRAACWPPGAPPEPARSPRWCCGPMPRTAVTSATVRLIARRVTDQNSASIGATVTRVLHGVGESPVECDQSVGLELGQSDVVRVKRSRALGHRWRRTPPG